MMQNPITFVALVALLATACTDPNRPPTSPDAGADAGVDATPPACTSFAVSFGEAEIIGAKPNGDPWDETFAEGPDGVIIVTRAGETLITTTPSPDSYVPQWKGDHPFEVAIGDALQIGMFDDDGGTVELVHFCNVIVGESLLADGGQFMCPAADGRSRFTMFVRCR